MLCIKKKEAKPGIHVDEIAAPIVLENQVCIKIIKTALCGTDLHIYNWDDWAKSTLNLPRIIGHECVGEIIDLGSAVSGLSCGDIVSVEGHFFCANCCMCKKDLKHLCLYSKGLGIHLDGAFCESLCVPAENIRVKKPYINIDDMCLMDPFGNAVHAISKVSVDNKHILITGAGPIGIFIGLLCQHLNAASVILSDVSDYRLDLAKQVGIKHVVRATDFELDGIATNSVVKQGFDVGFEVSGSESALKQQIGSLAKASSLVLIGLFKEQIRANLNACIFKQITIKTVYGREIYRTWDMAEQFIKAGIKPSSLKTHQFSASQVQSAFEQMASRHCGKIFLDWS